MRFTSGLPETVCGLGSTLRKTVDLRRDLPEVLRGLGCRTLLDAPCGDCNWIAETDLKGIKYIGVDEDFENLRRAVSRLGLGVGIGLDYSLSAVDLLEAGARMPEADVVMCRDFLQHVPNEKIPTVIANLLASKAKWIMLTSHSDGRNKEDVELGGFRPIDLTMAPYSLPPALTSIADPQGSTRRLGVWLTKDLQR